MDMDWILSTAPAVEPVTLHEMREHLRIDSGTEIQLDFGGVAVDEGSGIVSLPAAAHGQSETGGLRIVVSGTDNFDGVKVTTSDTTADKIAFAGTYAAETFGTTSFVHTGGDAETLQAFITAAREFCEMFSNRAYITQTLTGKLDRFYNTIKLPRPNLQSVTSVAYLDMAGDSQTLDTNVYDVDTTSKPGEITLAYNQYWPSVRPQHHAITVIFVTGYGDDAGDVPAHIKSAIKLLCGHLYENREASSGFTVNEIPLGVKTLLYIDRVY